MRKKHGNLTKSKQKWGCQPFTKDQKEKSWLLITFWLKILKRECIDMPPKKPFKSLQKDIMEPFLPMDKVAQEKLLAC